MQQIIQSYRTGEVRVHDVPAPRCPSNGVLVRNLASLVSIGTERSMIQLGKKSLIGKARARPDLVKRALEKAKREGFWKTFQEALARLDTPTPLGYSSAGVVLEVGVAATGFSPGDRVACVGHGFASHAEIISVPSNMACRVPDNVSDEEASFVMLGAIALHGMREAKLGLGGTVAVLGLGLLGLLTVQMLRAYGCQVVAMDLDPAKAALAQKYGATAVATSAEEMLDLSMPLTAGLGCDAVIITAATDSAEPVNLAVSLSRQKARIVIVGVADVHPDRNEMWQKEVEIIVSKAGGAGALDPVYELEGIDLPVGYARWTQARNIDEFLRLIADGRLDVKSLITHRLPLADSEATYKALADGTLRNATGIILQYPETVNLSRVRSFDVPAAAGMSGKDPHVAVLGAGQFGRSVLLPALVNTKGIVRSLLATASGATAEHAGKRFGFQECSTDADEVFKRSEINAIFALTPHSRHAANVTAAVKSGKHIFVEKPLCVTEDELEDIKQVVSGAASMPTVMVGHNRRYSPHTKKMQQWLAKRKGPLVLSMRINAGYVPPEHWVHAEAQGRSRIVGEMTHFLDLIEAIASSAITELSAIRIKADAGTLVHNDNVTVNIRLADGSVASLVYSSQGSRGFPREHIEIYSGGSSIVSTDFRSSVLYGKSRDEKFKTSSQEYGYSQEISHFIDVVKGGASVEADIASAFRIMDCAFAIERSIATGKPEILS